jgi:hypothetical protein
MPTDPGDNLPLAQLHVPLLLNGRPTAPTTAAAAAAASLARRRQQQQAAVQAAAAQQQQAQLLAAAAAAQAAAVRQEEYKTDMADLTGAHAAVFKCGFHCCCCCCCCCYVTARLHGGRFHGCKACKDMHEHVL